MSDIIQFQHFPRELYSFFWSIVLVLETKLQKKLCFWWRKPLTKTNSTNFYWVMHYVYIHYLSKNSIHNIARNLTCVCHHLCQLLVMKGILYYFYLSVFVYFISKQVSSNKLPAIEQRLTFCINLFDLM